MLQKIRDKISGWFATVFLGAIAVVFIFWGIRFESSATASAAKVNGERIPLDKTRKAWQERQAQLQQMLRDELPDELVKSEQKRLLDDMIRRELLKQQADKLGYRVGDRKLAETLTQFEALQVDGKFSRDRYVALLRQQGRTEGEFERQLREELEIDELRKGIAISAFVTPGEMRRREELEGEERDVDHATIATAGYGTGVTVTAEQVAAWYEAHKADYMTQETVDLQYLELDVASVAAEVAVTDEALHKYYDEVVAERYTLPEQRRSRHILVETGSDAAASKAKAETLLKRVKDGEDFAKLAKENSDDPGSKEQGGELGWSGREAYVKPFADALFALKPGEQSGIVTTQFGYHIIQLEEVRPASQKPFDEVRAELESDYRREQAQSRFYDESQQLADDSFAALTELESVAAKLKIPLATVQGYTRAGGGAFGSEKAVIDAVFSPEVLEERQNSQPIPIGDDKVVVLRVVDHKLPQQRPLEAVHADIETTLRADAARHAASAAAQTVVDGLKTGASWTSALAAASIQPQPRVTLHRTDTTLPAELVRAIFAAPRPTDGHPHAGTATLASGDVAVFLVDAVRPGAPKATTDAAELVQRMRQQEGSTGVAEFSAYVDELERTANIKRNDKAFE
jgi:peptidyl-prolyl cis-trans isomerase D